MPCTHDSLSLRLTLLQNIIIIIMILQWCVILLNLYVWWVAVDLRTRTCLRLVLNALLEFVCFSCGMLSMFVCTGTPQDVFPDEKVIKSIFGLSNEVSRSSEWSKEEQIENQYNSWLRNVLKETFVSTSRRPSLSIRNRSCHGQSWLIGTFLG